MVSRIDEVRHVALGVAVLGGVQVEHELRERAVQARHGPAQRIEARAGELGGGLELEPADSGADLDVVARRKSERARRAPPPHFDVVRFGVADRARSACGRLGMPSSQSRSPAWMSASSRSSAPSSSPSVAHFGHQLRGVLAPALRRADLLGQRVALRLQLLGPRLDRLALGLDALESIAIEHVAALSAAALATSARSLRSN